MQVPQGLSLLTKGLANCCDEQVAALRSLHQVMQEQRALRLPHRRHFWRAPLPDIRS
jgi:hypothetical protein